MGAVTSDKAFTGSIPKLYDTLMVPNAKGEYVLHVLETVAQQTQPTLMHAIDAGYVEGPRIIPAGHAIGITGGHCDAGSQSDNEAPAGENGLRRCRLPQSERTLSDARGCGHRAVGDYRAPAVRAVPLSLPSPDEPVRALRRAPMLLQAPQVLPRKRMNC